MTRPSLLWTVLMFPALLLAGCAAPAAAPTATETATRIPTSTATLTAAPSETAAPSATNTPAPVVLTFRKNAFCRRGPGTAYLDVGSFNQGESALADGRSQDEPRWYRVFLPNVAEHCWVSEVAVEPNAAAEALPVQPVTAELPEPPADLSIMLRTCSADNFWIKLKWTNSLNADGYVFYRNGEELGSVLNGRKAFEDYPPRDTSLFYEIAAYNENGYSERTSMDDPGCP